MLWGMWKDVRIQTVTYAAILSIVVALQVAQGQYNPEIPRTWSDEALRELEIPIAHAEFSPDHVPADYYYQLPIREVWKSYPIYHPDREPPGYRDRLMQLAPEVVFDPATLATEQDWIDAGAEVFRAPIEFEGPVIRSPNVLNPAWFAANELELSRDGVFPFARWVIREKGKLEVGNLSCATCHTRVMSDGSTIIGAQGNFPLDRILARVIGGSRIPVPAVLFLFRQLTATPWAPTDSLGSLNREQLAAIRMAIPPGVIPRQGTSMTAPARIPDLIGVLDRKYLDASGSVIHDEIGDIMRYAALNQGMDVLARFGDLVPDTVSDVRPPPGKGRFPGSDGRYSDEQLFALAKYLYSLEPPPNPNPVDDLARHGQEVFDAQGCAGCHTPPLYTNNKLVPAPGFDPPAGHREKYDVVDAVVGTDPELTMETRRGTGYYKVPSLKGVWYRGPFGHSGWIATLEDWFDPARLREDYTPTAFAGTKGPHAVPGHRFGLDLPDDDKRALIAFLKTL
jgi:hypothetical protein